MVAVHDFITLAAQHSFVDTKDASSTWSIYISIQDDREHLQLDSTCSQCEALIPTQCLRHKAADQELKA